MDFDKKEPYIQFKLEIDQSDPDNNDETLKHLIEQASNRGMEVFYPSYNSDNLSPQLRLKEEPLNKIVSWDSHIENFKKFFLEERHIRDDYQNQYVDLAKTIVETYGGDFAFIEKVPVQS